MTFRVWHILLSSVEDGAILGHALVCPDARYAAMKWKDIRLVRVRPSEEAWTRLIAELGDHNVPGALPRDSALVETCLPPTLRASVVAQHLTRPRFEADSPEAVVQQLDEYLLQNFAV